MTSIEWTRGDDGSKGETWNPVVGCSRVSKGCEHCYAEGVAHRGMSPQHRGLTVMGAKGPRWNGVVRFVESALAKPLSWKKPRRVFVNSMSDLFHESLPFEQIAAVFGVMAATPHHTYQVLTKRPERAREFFAWASTFRTILDALVAPWHAEKLCVVSARELGVEIGWPIVSGGAVRAPVWPLPNVWLGVSVEDQATADERIPVLLELPAAVRFVSYEPALGPVDFTRLRSDLGDGVTHTLDALRGRGIYSGPAAAAGWGREPRLDWVIVGGESGPGARPFDLAWARSTIEACERAGVACFVKQLGARPGFPASTPAIEVAGRGCDCEALESSPDGWLRYVLRDRKGGDMDEWPADLRVRQFPEVTR